MNKIKIVGLMVARDEDITAGMTIETVKGLVDELVFVDNMSKDNTVEVVREACAKTGIILHEYQAGLENTVMMLRGIALEHGKELNPDWFFTCDADMIFKNARDLRKLAKSDKYDQYWFESINLTGGKNDISYGSINEPHLWLFRNIDGIYPYTNYVCLEATHKKDPNELRFLGWNLNGFKHYYRIFMRHQMQFSRAFNIKNGTNLSITKYMDEVFGGPRTDEYTRMFALNRLRWMCRFELEKNASFRKMKMSAFKKKYMKFPKILKDWDCPFELIYGVDGSVIGRKPDLVGVPVVEDEQIKQLVEFKAGIV